MSDIVTVLSVIWLGVWLADLLFNGRLWIWEFISLVPGFGLPLAWLILIALSLASGSSLATGLLLISVPLWWRAVDVNLWPRRKRTPNPLSSDVILFNWNTQHWVSMGKSREKFIQFLQSQQADIYHLQEAWDINLNQFDARAELQEYFPEYQIFQDGELVTMTRLPVVQVHPRIAQSPYLRVDARINDQTVAFYNAHVSVHLIPRYYKQRGLGYFLKDMRRRFKLRRQEFGILGHELSEQTLPFVVSGDFNTPKTLIAIRHYLRDFTDAGNCHEVGFPTTYYVDYWMKWWRIDYVLGNSGIDFLSYHCIHPGRLSDHWGLKTSVSVSAHLHVS